jgi:hypothetical protein
MSAKAARDSANGYQNVTVCNVTQPTIRTSCDDANAEGLDGTQPALSSAALRILAILLTCS